MCNFKEKLEINLTILHTVLEIGICENHVKQVSQTFRKKLCRFGKRMQARKFFYFSNNFTKICSRKIARNIEIKYLFDFKAYFHILYFISDSLSKVSWCKESCYALQNRDYVNTHSLKSIYYALF